MRAIRLLTGLAGAIFAAAVVMYVVSFWTGDALGGPVYTARFAIILILLCMLIMLIPRLGKGTLPLRLWSWIMLAIIINIIPVALETINAYAGRHIFSQDMIFLFYLLVFIPVLVVIGSLYFGFKKQGFAFSREALISVLPSMLIFIAVMVVVLIVPMARSEVPMGVRISDTFALVVQVMALCVVAFMAITIGRGEAGRPYLYISLALVSIMIQTILTAHIRLVGVMSFTEPADLFLQLAYFLLILAVYFQYKMTAAPVPE